MVPILSLLQIPEAAAAAPATIVGFIDMFIPAVLASGIEAEMTRFVIAALSLVQIIYLTEMGTLLIISKIPVGIGRLFLIFRSEERRVGREGSFRGASEECSEESRNAGDEVGVHRARSEKLDCT